MVLTFGAMAQIVQAVSFVLDNCKANGHEVDPIKSKIYFNYTKNGLLKLSVQPEFK